MLTLVIENISPRWKQVYEKVIDDVFHQSYYQISNSISGQVRDQIADVQVRDQTYANNNRREY
jgi:hypothetical protein